MADLRERGSHIFQGARETKEVRLNQPSARFDDAEHTYNSIIAGALASAASFTRIIENPGSPLHHGLIRPDEISILSRISILPVNSPLLDEAWSVLNDSLEPDPNGGIVTQRQMRTFYVADGLLHVTGSPTQKRLESQGIYVTQNGKAVQRTAWAANMFAVDERGQNEAPPHNIVGSKVEQLRNVINDRLSRVPATTEEAKEAFIVLNLLVESRNSDSYIYWDMHDRDTEDWFNQLSDFIVNNPFGEKLLLEGFLEELSPKIEIAVWIDSIGNTRRKEELTEYGELMEYFFSHPRAQREFWHVFPSNLADVENRALDKTADIVGRDANTEALIRASVHVPELLFLDTFSRTEIVKRFLATIATTGLDRKTNTAILDRAISLVGIFKTNSSDAEITGGVTKGLRDVSQKLHLDTRFESFLDILEDKSPGIIYYTGDKDLCKVRFPKKDETKEGARDSLEKQGLVVVIYSSNADWHQDDAKSQESAHTTQAREQDSIQAAKTEFLARWGEVGVVGPMDQPALLNHLDSQLSKLRPDNRNGDLEKLVSSYSGQTKRPSRQRAVVLPDLLPLSDPLATLGKVGIIGIEHNGEFVTLVIDSRRAGIQSDSQRLTLNGHVNRDKTVSFAWGGKSSATDALRPLLTATVALGSTAFDEEGLGKQETSELHSLVKSYNSSAKKEGRPQVGLGERRDFDKQTVTFIGKKPVLLSLTS